MSNRETKFDRELVSALRAAARDEKTLGAFLDDLLSPTERHAMAQRWQIVRRLDRGASQRAVATDLDVGIATVSRGARLLSTPSGGFNKVLHAPK